MKKFIFLLIFLLIFSNKIFCQESYYPTYITGGVPMNEYTLFANSGWDGNWYVGSNMCWIKKFNKALLPPKELFSKIYVGAKLGRAKTKPKPSSPPWEKEIIDGNIYIGIASTPAWKSDQRYFLCRVKDIPTEGDWENAITTTGEAKWFFTEIPIEKVNFSEDIWICIYSNTPYLNSASSAPILAGAWREKNQKELNIWLNNEINGAPPINPNNSLKTQIRVFDPAIIIKLVPKGAENLPVEVKIAQITDGRPENDEKVFFIQPLTPNIECVYMEISTDRENFTRFSKYTYCQPFVFHLNLEMIPQEISGDFWIRFAARDIFGNVGYTNLVQLNITRPKLQEEKTKKK
ncbi:MAG: hypothetical protein N2505_04470 [Endomicrobia bacterium]|nr:hypothetical protein [Endomicrobiia bacterium]